MVTKLAHYEAPKERNKEPGLKGLVLMKEAGVSPERAT